MVHVAVTTCTAVYHTEAEMARLRVDDCMVRCTGAVVTERLHIGVPWLGLIPCGVARLHAVCIGECSGDDHNCETSYWQNSACTHRVGAYSYERCMRIDRTSQDDQMNNESVQ